MTLWQLLILICFGAPVGTSLALAEQVKAGIRGYALAVAVGLTVGWLCAWTMWKVHKVVVTNLPRCLNDEHLRSHRGWYFGVFYFTKILWILVAGILGYWLPLVLLRLVF